MGQLASHRPDFRTLFEAALFDVFPNPADPKAKGTRDVKASQRGATFFFTVGADPALAEKACDGQNGERQ